MKKTEKPKTAHIFAHMLVQMLIALTVLGCITITVFATPAQDADTSIQEMNTKIYTIYLLIRNNVAFPLLSLSFASCGFKILGAGIIGTGAGADKGIQAAKEQIIASVSALLLLLVLPYLISYGIDLFKSNAWTPPGVIHIPVSWLGGIL